MRIITGLSPDARADLVAFCAANLKTGRDPRRYAEALIANADFSFGAHFEIASHHAPRGVPVTTSYSADTDFVFGMFDE